MRFARFLAALKIRHRSRTWKRQWRAKLRLKVTNINILNHLKPEGLIMKFLTNLEFISRNIWWNYINRVFSICTLQIRQQILGRFCEKLADRLAHTAEQKLNFNWEAERELNIPEVSLRYRIKFVTSLSNSSVGIVTGCTTQKSKPGRGKKLYSSPTCPYRLWSPQSHLFKDYWRISRPNKAIGS